jgi:hypothetical protein
MGRRVLLVEGQDDQHVVWNVCKARDVREDFKVEHPGSQEAAGGDGGAERLLESIRWQMTRSDLERLAVVIDADDKGPEARWEAIRARLPASEDGEVPTKLPSHGAICEIPLPNTPRSVRFGAWIMPDNCSQGMLEDFVARMIREDDDMLPRVDGFLNGIPEGKCRFSPAHYAKARIHSWLAIQKDPGKPMGQAIGTQGSSQGLDTSCETVNDFLAWVRNALID